MLIKLYHKGCHSIINFVILRVRKCLDVAVNIWCQMICSVFIFLSFSFFWPRWNREVGTTITIGSRVLVILCTQLDDTNSRSRAKLAGAASGEGEPRDGVCEIADAPASFKSDPWKHFWFHRAKEWENKIENSMRPDAKLRLIHTNGNRMHVL